DEQIALIGNFLELVGCLGGVRHGDAEQPDHSDGAQSAHCPRHLDAPFRDELGVCPERAIPKQPPGAARRLGAAPARMRTLAARYAGNGRTTSPRTAASSSRGS